MAGWVKVGEVQVKRDWYDIYEKNKRFTWLVWGSKDMEKPGLFDTYKTGERLSDFVATI